MIDYNQGGKMAADYLNERNKLIQELSKKCMDTSIYLLDQRKVADFILQDRKRVVAPLIDYKNLGESKLILIARADEAIDETLKLAGIEV